MDDGGLSDISQVQMIWNFWVFKFSPLKLQAEAVLTIMNGMGRGVR